MTDQLNEAEIERTAQARLAAAEESLRRKPVLTLGATFRAFWGYPSPWMILAYVVGPALARGLVGGWALADVWAPLVFLGLFPVIEWLIHVFILHWRPRDIGRVHLDSLLARDHRRHHADPRDVPLVFIPWRALVWVIVGGVVLPLAIGRLFGAGYGGILTYELVTALALLGYEWTHYLIHSDYRPRTRLYKAVWRNHRLHHYKNEHYWFSVTTSGTSDRLLGTYPDPGSVPTSPTAKNLHGGADQLSPRA